MAQRSAPIKVPTESPAAKRVLTCTAPSSELANRFPCADPTASAPRFGTESWFRRIVFRLKLVENPAERTAALGSAMTERADSRREARRDDIVVGEREREDWDRNSNNKFPFIVRRALAATSLAIPSERRRAEPPINSA